MWLSEQDPILLAVVVVLMIKTIAGDPRCSQDSTALDPGSGL